MNTYADTGGLLEHAFRRFERAATSLEEGHAALRSEIERLDRQLLDAHRRLEAVLDALDSGVAVVAADGTLVRANRSFERMALGRQGEKIEDPVLCELVTQDTDRPGAARMRRSTPTGIRDLAAALVPVGDENETRVLTVQDVTDIRREEEEGGRRRRLEALGKMAAELAHEVRNPLGSIRLFATMLRDDLEEQPKLRESADHILAATSGLESAVSNLLAFASPSKGNRRALDMAALVRDACALLAPACALRGVRLEGPDIHDECPTIADPEGMRQLVLNLLGNSLAATKKGDRIHVATSTDGIRAVLTVEDTGCGIDPDDLPRVFDPFFSRREGGTGLGLSIVHGIVERHGGRITLESGCERGTRVRVETPSETRADAEKRHA